MTGPLTGPSAGGSTGAPTWYPALRGDEREALRARLFLRAVLPLLPVILREHPPTAQRLGALTGTVRIGVNTGDPGATLRFRSGQLDIVNGAYDPAQPIDVHCRFHSLRALNRFFAGRAALPRITGWRHPIILARTARLLLELRVLQPEHIPTDPAERRLRARLVLTLIAYGLAELYRGGHPGMTTLVDASPDRVYQWALADHSIAAYLRMERGQVKAGTGVYPGREPFVRYEFRDVDAVLRALGETDSQMAGLRAGLFRTTGSPEYTRKIAILMQEIDGLLMS